jgi:hypothetical protein
MNGERVNIGEEMDSEPAGRNAREISIKFSTIIEFDFYYSAIFAEISLFGKYHVIVMLTLSIQIEMCVSVFGNKRGNYADFFC